MKTLGVYITYENGVKQEKNLVDHFVYENIIIPLQMVLLTAGKNKSKKIKKDIERMFGEFWFTTESPLGKAIKTGILSLPKHQGGNTKCLINKK